ncbi:ester cyclase [Edaphobacter dinghuensis]|nr:ester cyclase [Edaphobacter dinghuensis]
MGIFIKNRAVILFAPETERKKMSQDNAKVVREFADEVITNGKIETASHYAWEDVVEQVSLPGQGPGLDGLKDIIRAMRTGFPDLVFSIQEQITENDKVASRFEWTGVHKGEFLGIPATGQSVRVWGIVIDRLEDGRIKDTRILMDTLGLMTQLGVLPAKS